MTTMEIISKTRPWAHQRAAYDFAIDKHGVMLAMDMGTGKSFLAVTLVVNRHHNLTVIVCPLSVIDVWPGQFDIHAGRPVQVLPLKKGTVARRVKAMIKAMKLREANGDPRPLAVVMNYECFRAKAMADYLFKIARAGQLDFLVLDESHRIKSPSGKGSWAASRLGQVVPWRACLTGTPMPHSPLDVYAQYRFLDREVFGWSFRRFKQKYAIMGGYMMDGRPVQVVGFRNMDDLNRKFYSRAFLVKKADVLDLPDHTTQTRTCKLGAAARKAYDELESLFVTQVQAGEVTVANALVKLLRLQQIANGFVRPDDAEEDDAQELDDSKTQLLLDVVRDLPASEPLVVFCRFRHDILAIKRVLNDAGRAALELSGHVKELAEWQAGQAPALVVQIQAGGVGVDLTRAAYCIYFSVGFNLGDFIQSQARVHRPGQTRNVTYIHLIAEDTVEEKVMAALTARENLVEGVLRRTVK